MKQACNQASCTSPYNIDILHPMATRDFWRNSTPYLTLIRRGGQICPTNFQMLIPQEPKVGLTSNQAVNSSLIVVSRLNKNWPIPTMKEPWRTLLVQGSPKFSTFYGLTQMKIVIGYIFAFYSTKMGSRVSEETKIDPHWVQDTP